MSIDRVTLVLTGIENRIRQGSVVRRASTILVNELVAETPVRDGIAKSNWYVNVHSPSLEVDEKATHQKPNGLKGLNAKAEDTVWVANNLPYIVRLDNGWSGQAPNGFSQTAIRNTQRKIDIVVKEIVNGS